MLPWYYNIPLFNILGVLAMAILSPLIKNRKTVRYLTCVLFAVSGIFSLILTFILLPQNESFVYHAGFFPAPWGNELKCGVFEAFMAAVFAFVMLFSVLGGMSDLKRDLEKKIAQYYYMMLDVLFASMLAIIFTNDIFTAYVFIEINTVGAFFIVMAKEKDDTYLATVHYFVMSMLGSGLILLSIAILYAVTGQLNMAYLFDSIQALYASGAYRLPLMVAAGLMTVGLFVKSALFPFHTWLPKASSSATSASSAILSGLVTKGYIILLIKVYYRVFGIQTVKELGITSLLLFFGIIAMIGGSLSAIRQTDIKKMIACSSVSQIGYIYVGIGLATPLGLLAAVYHIVVHAITKADMFVIAGSIVSQTGTRDLRRLDDIGPRMPVTAAMFTICALSMVGIPLLMGFNSKWNFASASVESGNVIVIIALVLSTLLNAFYYFPPMIRGYFSSGAQQAQRWSGQAPFKEIWPHAVLTALIVLFGIFSGPLTSLIHAGLMNFF
jgi:multicomponent Na+:H+ antiporter subunit D